MALTAYQQQTQRLLNDESAQFFNIADLTAYINNARNDIARQAECIVLTASLATVNNQRSYAVTTLTPPAGTLNPIGIRSLAQVVAGVSTVLEGRSWQWFTNYYNNGANSNLVGGTISVWAMQNLGILGNISLFPTPNGILTINVEASWYPIALVNDTTAEAIPEPWASAVPYFAAYQAYLQAQRMQDAQNMFNLYNAFLRSARMGVTPNWTMPSWPTPKPLASGLDTGLTLGGPTAQPSKTQEGQLGG